MNWVVVYLIAMPGGCFAVAGWLLWRARRVYAEAERWNNATDPAEIQSMLPPGHRYDPATRLVHRPEPGALPYKRGQKVVRP